MISSSERSGTISFPWKYAVLNPEVTAEIAYKDYEKGHCMYGVFSSVISQLADTYGEPYRSFPLEMMRYGFAGVAEWGSLCGAVNGAAALIGLFTKKEEELKELIDELFLWYE